MTEPKPLRGRGYFKFKSFYREIARRAPTGARVIEVGVLHGHSLIWLKEARPDLDLIGVDWGRGAKRFAPQPHAGILVMNLADRKLDIPILLGNSPSMARFIPDKSAWAVFIDGDHTEEGVRADLEAWTPKVMEGGLIAGDDYGGKDFPGVKIAVDEAFPDACINGQTWIKEDPNAPA